MRKQPTSFLFEKLMILYIMGLLLYIWLLVILISKNLEISFIPICTSILQTYNCTYAVTFNWCDLYSYLPAS